MILALLSSSVICHLHLLLRVGRFLTCRPTLLLVVPQLVSFTCPLHVVSGTVSFSFSPAPPAFYKSMSMRIKIKYMYHLHPELQIIFESNAYLRPKFWLNADFQISKSIFTPCNFSQCWKERYYCFEVPYLSFFWCYFIALVVTCYYLLLHLSIYWPYFDNMLTNGQTDWHR